MKSEECWLDSVNVKASRMCYLLDPVVWDKARNNAGLSHHEFGDSTSLDVLGANGNSQLDFRVV